MIDGGSSGNELSVEMEDEDIAVAHVSKMAPVSEMVPLAPKTNSPISELSLDDEEYNEIYDESPSVETKKPAPEKCMNING